MRVRAVRAGVAGVFAAQGFGLISLTTRLPREQQQWHLSSLEMSGVLLLVVALAGAGSVLAEVAAGRWGSARLLRAALAVQTVTLPAALLTRSGWVWLLCLAAYGAALGVVDAAGNMQAVAVEHRYARPILPSFHGAWTTGGIVGAAGALLTADLPMVASSWIAVPALAAACAPLLARVALPAAPAAAEPIPWRPIVLVGLAMVLFYMVDTVATTWGPTYLGTVFPTPARLVALATFPYLVATVVLRVAGDRLVQRYGEVRVLRAGALVAFGALLLVAAAPTWPAAVLGFTLLGAGAAVIAPLSFSAAGRIAGGEEGGEDVDADRRRARVDAVIGRFNQFNYAGALLGAVLTGVVGADNLRWGFVLPTLLILAVWPLAPAFRGLRPSGRGSAPTPASRPGAGA